MQASTYNNSLMENEILFSRCTKWHENETCKWKRHEVLDFEAILDYKLRQNNAKSANEAKFGRAHRFKLQK